MQTPRNGLRQIRSIIYKLNRLYGVPGTLRRVLNTGTNAEIDPQTGEIAQVYSDIPMRRLIALPVRTDRTFEYDLAYIAVAKEFTQGGYYDRGTRQFIIEGQYLPLIDGVRPVIEKEDKIIISGLEYELKYVDRVEGNLGYLAIGVVANNRTESTYADT